MKKSIILVVFIISLPLSAEPLFDSLHVYARNYRLVSEEICSIADAVQVKYPVTYFSMDRKGSILEVMGHDDIVDTVIHDVRVLKTKSGDDDNIIIRKYDYEKLKLLSSEINGMIDIYMPVGDFATKSIYTAKKLPDSVVFEGKIKSYKYYASTLVEIAGVIKKIDSDFLPQYDRLENVYNIEHWRDWYDVMLLRQRTKIERSLQEFDVRYGASSEKINIIELFVINHVPPFKGNANGPSNWEPILRFTPVCYNFTDTRFIKTLQIGLNYYFFDGMLKPLNHLGIAFLLSDVTSEKIYELNALSFGLQLHIGKYQLGVVRDRTDETWRFISAIDFQIIPMLF